MLPDAASFGPEEFAEATGVSRETLDQLQAYADLLAASPHNLVSEASLKEVWHRHFLDCAQLVPLIPPEARTLADLGSGAGFPGLVLAILLRERLKVSLFEATHKKADFLASVAERVGVKVTIRNERIETAKPQRFDVITARAFAPLPELLGYAQRLAGPKTICLFLKGQSHTAELTAAERTWKMNIRKHPSQTHPLGVVLEIRDLIHVS
ncbi:16S rRNA (guanine(527)-N(7))-methyltransferase RsmG [Rhizomicrobium electricum]|uniref:Ribosomal RNA small subunit methyltransferase G n=1 Tax=Rhizomicrobium electricum TaxID=480070 RepID=A0ABN1F3E6_9PROT|nr:16S rRNA (guanine(527)-N(7))-methyltransferase RsmG [Rhizomicrobium electricum]NIJ49233.1 16S rRNA (guanine527-N7)-methyltransferase [Rhizomicrobium electricum]